MERRGETADTPARSAAGYASLGTTGPTSESHPNNPGIPLPSPLPPWLIADDTESAPTGCGFRFTRDGTYLLGVQAEIEATELSSPLTSPNVHMVLRGFGLAAAGWGDSLDSGTLEVTGQVLITPNKAGVENHFWWRVYFDCDALSPPAATPGEAVEVAVTSVRWTVARVADAY